MSRLQQALRSEVIDASNEDHERAKHAFVRALVVPGGWREVVVAVRIFGGRHFKNHDGGLLVAITVDTIDGAEWVHLSISRKSRTPSYEDLRIVKSGFLGDERPAYHVFPRATEHRNFHPFCLHLWQPIGADPFPDPLGERAGTIGPKP